MGFKKNTLILLFFCLWVVSLAHVYANESTVGIKSFPLRNSALTLAEDEILNLIQKEKPRVVFFGEDHRHENSMAFRTNVIERIKKTDPDFNCYFMEASPLFQPALDLVKKDGITAGFLKYIEIQKTTGFLKSMDERALNQFNDKTFRSFVLLGRIVRAQIMPYSVDGYEDVPAHKKKMAEIYQAYMTLGPTREVLDELQKVYVVERNQEIAKNMLQLMDQEKCKKVIFPVGTNHISVGEVGRENGLADISRGNMIQDLIPYKSVTVVIKECESSAKYSEPCSSVSRDDVDLNILLTGEE